MFVRNKPFFGPEGIKTFAKVLVKRLLYIAKSLLLKASVNLALKAER